MTRRAREAARWALVAAALAGGASAAARAHEEAGRRQKTHTIVMEGTAFQPKALTVSAGDTVVWVNKDPFPHTATSKEGGFDSGAIAAGESWRSSVEKKGEFTYVCTFHPTMKATLRVK